MGPVRLSFDGTASILERDEPGRRLVVDAAVPTRRAAATPPFG